MVNFTFVSHNGARPEQRELVKSHVMRESQKRRREEKQRLRHDLPAAYKQSVPQFADARTETLIESGVPPRPSLQRDLPIDPCPPILTFPRASRNDKPERQRMRRLSHPTVPRLTGSLDPQGLRVTRPINLHYNVPLRASYLRTSTHPPRPRILGPKFLHFADAVTDPSWMPETWLNRVDEIVSHYFMTFNGTGPDIQSTLTHWFQQPLKSPLILLSYCLLYCAHRDLIGGILGNDDHYFKARNLQMINAALEDRATALANETIIAVVSMAMYENLRGSEQVITHERGLAQMFDMRGGIDRFMSEKGFYIGNYAMLVDMMHSACSNKHPLLMEVKRPILRDGHMEVRKPYFPHSPLRVMNHPGFIATVSIEELRSSLDILRDAFDGFEMLCIEDLDPRTVENEEPHFRTRRNSFWARLQEGDATEAEISTLTLEGKVREAVRITGIIHCCAVVSQIQHDDELNTHFVLRLHEILKKLRLDFWKTAPYLYLWILLTGGAACSRLPDHRAYFISEIARVGMSVGFFDWRSFTQNMNNFLWLQDFLRKRTKR